VLPATVEADSQLQAALQVQRASADNLACTALLGMHINSLALTAVEACTDASAGISNAPLAQQAPPGSSMPAPGAVATAATAVWQLHTAFCRLVNWLANEEGNCSELLPQLHEPDAQLAMLSHLADTFRQLMLLHQCIKQAATASTVPGSSSEADTQHTLSTRWACACLCSGDNEAGHLHSAQQQLMPAHSCCWACRPLHAMCMAQWDAVRTLLGSANSAHARLSDHETALAVAASLAVALEAGPAALASSADLQEAFMEALHHLPQVGWWHGALSTMSCSVNNSAARQKLPKRAYLDGVLQGSNCCHAHEVPEHLRRHGGNSSLL